MMNKKFYYFDGTDIKFGDIVNGPSGVERRVDMIIQPGTEGAVSFACPDGGVVFVLNDGGVDDPILMTPPDGVYWEDFDFVRRSCC